MRKLASIIEQKFYNQFCVTQNKNYYVVYDDGEKKLREKFELLIS